jgi:hypothetical protein
MRRLVLARVADMRREGVIEGIAVLRVPLICSRKG